MILIVSSPIEAGMQVLRQKIVQAMKDDKPFRFRGNRATIDGVDYVVHSGCSVDFLLGYHPEKIIIAGPPVNTDVLWIQRHLRTEDVQTPEIEYL